MCLRRAHALNVFDNMIVDIHSIYTYMCVHIYIYTHRHVIYIHTHIYIYMYVHIHTCQGSHRYQLSASNYQLSAIDYGRSAIDYELTVHVCCIGRGGSGGFISLGESDRF